MIRFWRRLALGCCGLLTPFAALPQDCEADEAPILVERIAFEGNDVTRRDTLMRELPFGEGEELCLADIDAGRQAVLDLRLFRNVEWTLEEGDEGSVVTYSIRERWYLLAVPRVDANSDEAFGLGLSLGWDNVRGRNHRFSMSGVRRELKERTLDDETILSAGYNWRRFGGTRTNVNLRGRFSRESAIDGERRFQERNTSLGVGASRQLTSFQTGQGWVLGGNLEWKQSSNHGDEAPPDQGSALLSGLALSYTDLRSSVYSEQGISARVGIGASLPFAADYDQFSVGASVLQIYPIGTRAHQRLHLRAGVGSFHGGPAQRRSDNFELGGASVLRGYDNEFAEGDTFWTAGIEYLRPVYWDWLRLLAMLEVGRTHRANFPESDPGFLASIGVGFRVRFTWFVDAEFELGVAYPLLRGDGLRGFAGGA